MNSLDYLYPNYLLYKVHKTIFFQGRVVFISVISKSVLIALILYVRGRDSSMAIRDDNWGIIVINIFPFIN